MSDSPWIAARQASLSITKSRSSLKLMSIQSVTPSSHLILCHPLVLLPPIPPSIRVFSNESTLAWGRGQSTGVSALASFLPKNTQDWSPLERTGWISLQSKGLSRVFYNTTVQKHQFGTQLSSQSNSHIHTTTGKPWPWLDLLELTPKKGVLFIIEDWNAKVESQETPGVTGKFGFGIQNEARQTLIEFCPKNTLVIANTLFQQHKRRLYKWTSPVGQHRNQIDYILCSQRWRRSIVNKNKTRSWLWLRSWTPYYQIQTQIEESRENC